MTKPARSRKIWNQETRLAYVLLAPALLFLVVFMFVPILNVFQMSLFKTDKIGRLGDFVWFENYVAQIRDADFRRIVLRSAFWTLGAPAGYRASMSVQNSLEIFNTQKGLE